MKSKQHVWIRRIFIDPEAPLGDHLAAVVALLNEHAVAIAELSRDCDVDVSIGFGSESEQGGDVLSHDIIEQLARHPVSLSLDLYPPAAGALTASDELHNGG